MRWSVIVAIGLSIALRALLLLQSPTPTLASYEHLTYAKHILETGLPLLADNTSWLSAAYDYAPLYHYLVAFLGFFVPIKYAALAITNLAALSIPYLVYKLTDYVSTHKYAPDIAAIASSAAPLLYQQTVFETTPFSLALPLILLTLHVFYLTLKDPKNQPYLLVSAAALALTSPLALVLAAGLLLALVIRKIQHQTIPRKLTEATLFITFLSIWAALIFYSNAVQAHGIQILWMHPLSAPSIAQLATNIGVLTLIIGTYSAYNYLTEKHTPKAYPILATLIIVLLALTTQIIDLSQASLLASILFLPLCARFINIYTQQRHRSRIPKMYYLFSALILVVFLTTHLLPAITQGTQTLQNQPTQQQLQLVEMLQPSDKVYLWTQETGFLLQYYGHRTIITQNVQASPQSKEILEDLQQLTTANPVRYIEILSRNGINRVITPINQTPQNTRCFSKLYNTGIYEVNQRECVIESYTA